MFFVDVGQVIALIEVMHRFLSKNIGVFVEHIVIRSVSLKARR